MTNGTLVKTSGRCLFASDSSQRYPVRFGSDTANPSTFSAGMVQSSVSRELFDNPKIRSSQQKYAIFLCATEILEVQVQSVNSNLAITEFHYAKEKTLVRVVISTTAADTFFFSSDALRQGFMLAGLEKTTENLAASCADAFSRTFVALILSVTEPVVNSVQ